MPAGPACLSGDDPQTAWHTQEHPLQRCMAVGRRAGGCRRWC